LPAMGTRAGAKGRIFSPKERGGKASPSDRKDSMQEKRQPKTTIWEMLEQLTPKVTRRDEGGEEVIQASAVEGNPSTFAESQPTPAYDRDRALTSTGKRLEETAGYDEYVRWCGRTGAARRPPTRLSTKDTKDTKRKKIREGMCKELVFAFPS
jgi:hypothetical protein